ncbi:secA [Symbiodinium necroappetens]|uniref:SecA protein n=1 Tax=Symbiodinium necroappetens TaxID=1628268 RepID=A0A812MTJ3_9DINO|nr:secA [Symbiodinium necroappetens]
MVWFPLDKEACELVLGPEAAQHVHAVLRGSNTRRSGKHSLLDELACFVGNSAEIQRKQRITSSDLRKAFNKINKTKKNQLKGVFKDFIVLSCRREVDLVKLKKSARPFVGAYSNRIKTWIDDLVQSKGRGIASVLAVHAEQDIEIDATEAPSGAKDIEIDATEAPGGVKALGVFFDWGSGASMEQTQIPKRSTFTVSAAGDEVLYFLALGLCRTKVTSICKELGIPLRGPNPGAEELGQACEALGLKSDLPMWDCIKQCREKIGQGTVLPMLLQEKLKLVHGALPSSKPETEWHCTAESLKEAAEMCGISIGWFTRDNWHTVMDLCLEFLGKADKEKQTELAPELAASSSDESIRCRSFATSCRFGARNTCGILGKPFKASRGTTPRCTTQAEELKRLVGSALSSLERSSAFRLPLMKKVEVLEQWSGLQVAGGKTLPERLAQVRKKVGRKEDTPTLHQQADRCLAQSAAAGIEVEEQKFRAECNEFEGKFQADSQLTDWLLKLEVLHEKYKHAGWQESFKRVRSRFMEVFKNIIEELIYATKESSCEDFFEKLAAALSMSGAASGASETKGSGWPRKELRQQRQRLCQALNDAHRVLGSQDAAAASGNATHLYRAIKAAADRQPALQGLLKGLRFDYEEELKKHDKDQAWLEEQVEKVAMAGESITQALREDRTGDVEVHWDGFWKLTEDSPEPAFDQMEAVLDALLEYMRSKRCRLDEHVDKVELKEAADCLQQLEQVSGLLDGGWRRKLECLGPRLTRPLEKAAQIPPELAKLEHLRDELVPKARNILRSRVEEWMRSGSDQYSDLAHLFDQFDHLASLGTKRTSNKLSPTWCKKVVERQRQLEVEAGLSWEDGEVPFKVLRELVSMEESLGNHIPELGSKRAEWKNSVKKVITRYGELADDSLGKWRKDKTGETVIVDLAKALTKLTQINLNLPRSAFDIAMQDAKMKVKTILEACSACPRFYVLICKLGEALQSEGLATEDRTTGAWIFKNYPQFREWRTRDFNQRAMTKPKADILKEWSLPEADKKALDTGYDMYQTVHDEILDRWEGGASLEELAEETIALARSMPSSSAKWTASSTQQLCELLGHVSAMYSMTTCGDAYKHFKENPEAASDGQVEGRQLLKRLHPSQVFACLRLLGCSSAGELRSHLMQVSTGEGKSIILGCLACVLGLLGKKVSVVCYSPYLSQRDQQEFLPLFECFQLQDAVSYDTIIGYVEKKVPDMRGHTESLLSREECSDRALPERSSEDSEEVLLVDEVDVFFGEGFLGDTFNQVAQVEAYDLLKRVWDLKDRDPSRLLEELKKSAEYASLKQRLGSQWDFVLKGEVERMCAQLQEFQTSGQPQPCHFDEDEQRIGYLQDDTVNYDVSFGYMTIFEYLRLNQQGRLSDESLKKVLKLQVLCARYSYANFDLPNTILGVSGTVGDLTADWCNILQETFGVDPHEHSLMPSVFGESNLLFLDGTDRPILICDGNDLHLEIAKAIIKQLDEGRAVLVFFEDQNALDTFFNSEQCRQLRSKLECLSELTCADDRTRIVFHAATKGHVTLCSSAFGRGTDFISSDSQLIENGGVHVIQTFFSVDKAEETQVKGRTARQGQPGSYSMILSKQGLEKQGMESIPQGSPSEIYEAFEKFREQQGREWKVQMDLKLQSAKRWHQKTHDYAVATGKSGSAKAFRALYTASVGSGQRRRIVFVCDATGSMCRFWAGARQAIGTALSRLEQIGGDYDFMWIAYRDYCDEDLMEKSCWTRDADELKRFMDGIICYGGGRLTLGEALEVGLEQARIEHEKDPISGVIVVGDEPARDEVTEEEDFVQEMQTDFRSESQKLRDQGIPVYSFRVGDCRATKRTFETIAEMTGGEFHDLNTQSDSLVQAICTFSLTAAGDAELLAEYKKRYES